MQLLDDEPTGFSTHPTMISDDAATFLNSPSVATIFHYKASLFEPEQNHLHFTKHPNALPSSWRLSLIPNVKVFGMDATA
jgi:hypothetical protein